MRNYVKVRLIVMSSCGELLLAETGQA